MTEWGDGDMQVSCLIDREDHPHSRYRTQLISTRDFDKKLNMWWCSELAAGRDPSNGFNPGFTNDPNVLVIGLDSDREGEASDVWCSLVNVIDAYYEAMLERLPRIG